MTVFNPQGNTVATPSEAYLTMARDFMRVDDLDGGVRRMRWRADLDQTWLPKEEGEESRAYGRRVARSELFPGLRSALDNAVTKPFSQSVQLDNLPPEWEDWVKNIDGQGSDVTQFSRQWMRSAIKHGLAHCFVDYTQVTGDVTAASERATGARPVWRTIEATDLISWKSAVSATGEAVLTEIRYLFYKDGKEFLKIVTPTEWQIHENEAYKPPVYRADNSDSDYYRYQDNRNENWKPVNSGSITAAQSFTGVPLVTLYTKRRGYMLGTPAMLDLAETNLTHWQSASDQRNLMHVTRVPVLAMFGMDASDDSTVTIGSGTAIRAGVDSRIQYIEHSGSAMGLGMDDLENLEERMVQLGVRPHQERTGDITATGIAVGENRSNTDIQAWLTAGNAALMQAFELSAEWLNTEVPEDFTASIFNDFAIGLSDGADMNMIVSLMDKYPDAMIEVGFREIKRRGLFGDGVDIDELVAKVLEGKEQRAQAARAQFAPSKPDDSGIDDSDDDNNPGGMPDDREGQE